MSVAGKIILVAGSGKGTGRQIALAAATAGADLIVSARTESDVDAVAREIATLGRRALAIAADFSDAAQGRTVVEKAVQHFGRIDSLIYNAAWEHPRSFLKIDEAHWDRMLDTNLKGYFILSQAVAAAMVQRQVRGNIVAIASSAGTIAFPNNADYCASKGGMIALTKAMAIDLASHGIRANAVAPGFIQGEAVAASEAGAGAAVLRAVRTFLPSRRFAEQTDVAQAALFLAGEESAYCNGTVLAVDGGLTLGNLPVAS